MAGNSDPLAIVKILPCKTLMALETDEIENNYNSKRQSLLNILFDFVFLEQAWYIGKSVFYIPNSFYLDNVTVIT